MNLKILKTRLESPTLKRIVLGFENPQEAFSFETGQYVKLAQEGKGEGYYAIASSPLDKGQLEFLVRDQEKGFSHEFFMMGESSQVATTQPMGKGFPLSLLAGKKVTFIAAGSGISPMASCIRALVKNPSQCKGIKLFYGERDPDGFAYRDELKSWAKHIEVFQVVSRPDGSQWKGLTGHVQDHIKGRVHAGADSVVCLCGMKGMVEGTTKILKELGVPEGNILLNY